MATIRVRKPREEDFQMELGAADRVECEAAGFSTEVALRESVAESERAWTFEDHLGAVAMCGYTRKSPISNTAQAWLLTSARVALYPHNFLSFAKKFVRDLPAEFTRIEILVHTQHTTAIRWLEWLGFQIFCATVLNKSQFYIMEKVR